MTGPLVREGASLRVYVAVLRDDRVDDVVQVWTDPAAARAAVGEWAKSKINEGDPIWYSDYDDGPLILVVEIGDGTAYEGRYSAYLHVVEMR